LEKTEVWKGGKLQTKTIYDDRLGEGYEIANYSYTYYLGGTQDLKNTTYYYYDTGDMNPANAGRAADTDVTVDSALMISETYKGDHETYPTTTKLQSRTYYAIQWGKGEEIADYTNTYNFDLTIRTHTKYYYFIDTDNRFVEAGSADLDAYMTRTIVRRDSDSGDLKQIAFYKGWRKGEELINWSYEYSGDGLTRKTITTYDYDITTGKTDCLREVKVYRDRSLYTDSQATAYTRPSPSVTKRKSRTIYRGDFKGEEIVDYAYNYQSDGLIYYSTTIN
ncbi:unnamed protein product, partial [marine sediment metagenome]